MSLSIHKLCAVWRWVIGGLLFGLASVWAAPPAVTLGVFPYLSPSQLVEQLEPLRAYLEHTLERPVVLTSAPDFMSFVERTRRGEYDIAIAGAHMARLAQKRDGWRLLAMSGQQTVPVILTRRDSGITRLTDLRGKRLAVGSRHSITYLLAEQALARHGVRPQQLTVLETATFSNVLQSILLGEAEAGVTPTLLWDNWVYANAAQRGQLSELYRAPPPNPPSFVVMVPPTASAEFAERLRRALLKIGDTPAGRDFLRQSQFHSLLPPDEKALARADPLIHVLIQDKP